MRLLYDLHTDVAGL